ncbi:MAG: 6-phosphogluconolactonase, partial [Phycisphaeraceae bacterium]
MAQSPPKLTGDVHVREDREELFDDLAQVLMAAAHRAVEERGAFHLALSGGSTPERFYMRLVIDPRFREIPWRDTHVWLVDERRVPLDDELSNFRMIRESLIDHVPLRRRQIHPMPVSDDNPAAAYERELRDVFEQPRDVPQLDFVLLGMG